MTSPKPDSSEPSMHQGSLVTLTKESEPINPDCPNSYILETTDDNIEIAESPGISSSETTKMTAEETGVNTISDDKEGGSSKNSKYINKDEETLFFSLIYDGFLKLMESNKLEDNNINDGLAVIKDAFRFDLGHRFLDIDFKKPENICAYLYRYGPYAAGLTRFRTLQAMNECEQLLSQLKASSSVNIISLGSGPGCDMIGLCSALYEHVRYQRVKLTLVDSVKGWSSAFNIIECLTREGEYGNASRLFKDSDVSTTFLPADLSDETEDEVYSSALKEADVILICKLFSSLQKDQHKKIEQKIVKTMKTGALLLLINAPEYCIKGLKLVYKTITDESYYFQGDEVKKRFSYSIARETAAKIQVYTKKSAK